MDNYLKIVQQNLKDLYANLPDDLAQRIPATRKGKIFSFQAFGRDCRISPGGVELQGDSHDSILSILISLYARSVTMDLPLIIPFRAYKEFPDTAPYAAAFVTHTEQVLTPHVETIRQKAARIVEALDGTMSPKGAGGDFSILVRPLPKICLCYIFYEADEDFPASVTCLFSNNANLFLPNDALADVGEYTSKTIIDLVS